MSRDGDVQEESESSSSMEEPELKSRRCAEACFFLLCGASGEPAVRTRLEDLTQQSLEDEELTSFKSRR